MFIKKMLYNMIQNRRKRALKNAETMFGFLQAVTFRVILNAAVT